MNDGDGGANSTIKAAALKGGATEAEGKGGGGTNGDGDGGVPAKGVGSEDPSYMGRIMVRPWPGMEAELTDMRLFVQEEVAEALGAGRAVVALESTVISHGLPRPHNLETARGMEAAIRAGGAVPATIAVLGGKLVVGISAGELAFLAESKDVAKVSRADLASVVASGRAGATTVAATAFVASRAGIRVFATGGIGGVHRGVVETLDISADLTELARTPVAVVCAGAKAILDLPRTLEMLETLGVPVVGYGTSELPAFYSRESGLRTPCRVDSAQEAAQLMATQWELGLTAGIVFANPPPEESALSRREVEALIEKALADAAAEKIQGKRVTPYLLESLSKGSRGRTLAANVALLLNNARVAAEIAVADAGEKGK